MTSFRYKHGDRPLEGYTIQRAVGRGGFGEVYYALSDSGREVALKVVQGYEQIELRGVSACMNLKSPHLVTIFDIRHNNEGTPFVIMEYVSGPSLRELIDQSPAGIGPQKAAFFLREIAKGLTYLHDRGIVHRDLKPGNIFYEDGFVKIGDYGLSKAISASRHSGQTVTVGTVHYMAPEIGQGRYDRGIDIYSLGVVLYEMLTSQTPFLGATPGEILMKHLASAPDLSNIEEPFASVVRKAMAKDPADRYQSAQEMVEAVFGAEHVRNSVSHFRPETLSVAAERAAQKVVMGGPGSSGDHTGARLEGGRQTPSPQGVENGETLSDYGQRMGQWGEEFGRRMGKWGEEFGRKMGEVRSRVEDKLAGRKPSPPPVPPLPCDLPADADALALAGDPMDWNQRRLLAVLTAGVIAMGSVFLLDLRYPPIWLGAFIFAAITGAAGGVIVARYKLASALVNENVFIQRLAFGGFAGLCGLICCSQYFMTLGSSPHVMNSGPSISFGFFFVGFIFLGQIIAIKRLIARKRQAMQQALARNVASEWGRLIYLIPLIVAMLVPWFHYTTPKGQDVERLLTHSLAASGITLFLLKWQVLTSPLRPERLSLGSALWAGLLAWIVAEITPGPHTLIPSAIMAGIVLVSQVLSPFNAKVKGRSVGGTLADGHGPNAKGEAAANAAGAAPPVPSPVPAWPGAGRSPGHAWAAGQNVRQGVSQFPVLPVWARVLFLCLFASSCGIGLLLLIWSGAGNLRYEEFGIALGFGLGGLAAAAFFIYRATRRTYRNWWVSFVRPLVFLACIQSAIMSMTVMGSVSHLSDDELLIGLVFIIFPLMATLVIAFVPGPRDRLGPDHGHKNAFSVDASGMLRASSRLQMPALVLACMGFLPFCPLAGLHRFYVGKVGTGILWLLTGGLLGIGTIVDVIMICTGKFIDKHGLPLQAWFNLKELKNRIPSAYAGKTPPSPPPPTFVQAAAGSEPTPPVAVSESENAMPRNDAPATSPEYSAPMLPTTMFNGQHIRSYMTGLLIAFASLIMSFGLAIGVIVAVHLPTMVAAGFPDPSLSVELHKLFGYAGWPQLLERTGTMLSILFVSVAVLFLVIARRRAGVAHTFRAVLGAIALLLSLKILSDVLAKVNWAMVVDMFEHERIGPAIELILNYIESEDMIMFGALVLGGMTLLIWPERRRPATSVREEATA